MIRFVLPAFNEEAAITPLIERILRLEGRIGANGPLALVVDDGSTDATAARTVAFDARKVRLVSHGANRGLGAAVVTGITCALEDAGDEDLVVLLDADSSHDPELALPMQRSIDAGHDVVIASRYQPGARIHGVPRHRQLLSEGMSLLFRCILPVPGVKDFSCGFRAYRVSILRRAVERWGPGLLEERGFSCMVELLVKLWRVGARFAEVPMELRYDLKVSPSKMRVWRTVWSTLKLLGRERLRGLEPLSDRRRDS